MNDSEKIAFTATMQAVATNAVVLCLLRVLSDQQKERLEQVIGVAAQTSFDSLLRSIPLHLDEDREYVQAIFDRTVSEAISVLRAS